MGSLVIKVYRQGEYIFYSIIKHTDTIDLNNLILDINRCLTLLIVIVQEGFGLYKIVKGATRFL
ncbi:hypothetical protein LCGC14_1792560 [marine sediment metagenome]|uniref:Uncharacterized protein n=1 Tax=marine sediment metagenome TaxID=412755 RepID=A0A0F9GS29_9ZZZZ